MRIQKLMRIFVRVISTAAAEVTVMAHGHLEGTYMLLFDPATLPWWSTIKRYMFAADAAEWLTFTLKHSETRAVEAHRRITDSTSGRFMAKQRHTALKTLTVEHRSVNLFEVRASTAPKFCGALSNGASWLAS